MPKGGFLNLDIKEEFESDILKALDEINSNFSDDSEGDGRLTIVSFDYEQLEWGRDAYHFTVESSSRLFIPGEYLIIFISSLIYNHLSTSIVFNHNKNKTCFYITGYHEYGEYIHSEHLLNK